MCEEILISQILFSQINYQTFLSEMDIEKYFCLDDIDPSMIIRIFCLTSKISFNNADLILKNFFRKYSDFFNSIINTQNENNVLEILVGIASTFLKIDKKTQNPVCFFDKILEWHKLSSVIGEDFLITPFLAVNDIRNKNNRERFEWPYTVLHDNESLNNYLNEEMSELHSHLYGSSINFELNWLSLMNKISNRKQFFDKLDISLTPRNTLFNYSYTNLYPDIIKAAAIRFILFSKINDNNDLFLNKYKKIILEDDEVLLILYANQLDNDLQAYRQAYGKRFSILENRIVDYALTNEYVTTNNEEYIALAGERQLLYNIFYKSFDNSLEKTIYPSLVYKYILIKNRLREELVQINKIVGFDNFTYFERRKEAFIDDDPIYHNLLIRIAINSFINDRQRKRYLETRITPKESSQKMIETINKLDHIVEYDKDTRFCKNNYNDLRKYYSYILHFIKTKDSKITYYSNLFPRNKTLRDKVKIQAEAIASVLQTNEKIAKRICSIDAANSEINARPEVFAQAFRYIRGISQSSKEMNFTYHVGEDFLDIVDGLRAVDEVLTFLNFKSGDRIGHALVLGINVVEYYKTRCNKIVLSNQMILDNYVWLICKSKQYNIRLSGKLSNTIENKIQEYIAVIYQDNYSINDYYYSWLLRGNNPDFTEQQFEIGWYEYNLNNKRTNFTTEEWKKARELFNRYHYDSKVKQIGEQTTEVYLNSKIVKLISKLQRKLLIEITQKGISIETNPTSNYRIGGFNSYNKHPIFVFNNQGIHTHNKRNNTKVSINTDDLGVFNTSLEREYSLIAAAALNQNNKIDRVVKWIDSIRDMSNKQRFN